jgi:hypothetical protein
MKTSGSNGLLTDLFDFSFSHLLVLRVVKLLFGVLLLLDAGLCLGLIVQAFGAGFGWGLLVLLFSPMLFVIVAIFVRVFTEILVVLFRIADDTAALAAETKREHGGRSSRRG